MRNLCTLEKEVKKLSTLKHSYIILLLLCKENTRGKGYKAVEGKGLAF